MKRLTIAALLACAAPLAPAAAQTAPAAQAVTGVRLDVAATGEVTRVPDLVRINAGVVTQSPNASEAIRQNAARMAQVRAALRRAGVADRDIQTSNISLQPDYRYQDNQPPQLNGYRASNTLDIRFRDIDRSGPILDALVAEGANQINGPMLEIERPEAALDEARTRALAVARARAEIYAGALGMRVKRIVSVSEPGAMPVMPMPAMRLQAADAATEIAPGEQRLSVTLNVSFELE
jgi:uncharacterized protein